MTHRILLDVSSLTYRAYFAVPTHCRAVCSIAASLVGVDPYSEAAATG